MAPDAEKRASREPRLSRDSRTPQERSRERNREAEHDRMRLAAMGIEGGGESPARPVPVPIIRILSDVQIAPPTTGMQEETPITLDDDNHPLMPGAQPTAPQDAPAPPGDARETAIRGRDHARAPRGSTDAARGSRDRAQRSLSRGSGSAPRGCADADRGSRDRASEQLSRDSDSAPRGGAAVVSGPRDPAERPPSRDGGSAASGGANVVHAPADTATLDNTKRGKNGTKPLAAPSSDSRGELRKTETQTTDTLAGKSKASSPSPGRRAQAILESRRPSFKKTNNSSLIKRTPEKKTTTMPPSPQRPGAPHNSPTTPVRIPTARKSAGPSYLTPQLISEQPKPQRPPRKLEVDVSSSAASRDSSVASTESGPKDVKNRVQKLKSPASHPPAFATTSGTRGRKRAQEDEPEFKQPATIPRYSSQITPPQPAATTVTTATTNATTTTKQRRGRRAKKQKAKQQINKEATQPDTLEAAPGHDGEARESQVTHRPIARPRREEPSTSTSVPGTPLVFQSVVFFFILHLQACVSQYLSPVARGVRRREDVRGRLFIDCKMASSRLVVNLDQPEADLIIMAWLNDEDMEQDDESEHPQEVPRNNIPEELLSDPEDECIPSDHDSESECSIDSDCEDMVASGEKTRKYYYGKRFAPVVL
ncbi:hypothetical protein ACJJTC_006822 [Scirpophaga incertulas]